MVGLRTLETRLRTWETSLQSLGVRVLTSEFRFRGFCALTGHRGLQGLGLTFWRLGLSLWKLGLVLCRMRREAPPRSTARKSLSAEGAIGVLARRVPSTSQHRLGYSLHGKAKLGSTATTRRVKEYLRYTHIHTRQCFYCFVTRFESNSQGDL